MARQAQHNRVAGSIFYSIRMDTADPAADHPANPERDDMKAYLVLDLTVNDVRGFQPYAEAIPDFIAKHGGQYIVRGVKPTVVEGDWRPPRVVVIEFPARANAEAFLADPDCQDLFRIRHQTTTSRLVLVDGCT